LEIWSDRYCFILKKPGAAVRFDGVVVDIAIPGCFVAAGFRYASLVAELLEPAARSYRYK